MIIAIDDGFAETKIAWMTDAGIRCHRELSVAQPGVHGMTTLSGDVINAFESAGQRFTTGSVMTPEPTAFDEYPLSPLNRVIIHHAILQSGIDLQAPLEAGLTLPMSVFYGSATFKTRREQAFLEPVRCVSDSARKMPEFSGVHIFPEGAVAWIDAHIDDHGVPVRSLDSIGPVAIVDIGGRTTDTAIFPRMNSIDQKNSGSDLVGVMNVKEMIRLALIRRFEVSTISAAQVDCALKTGNVNIFGNKPVQDLVDDAKKQIAQEIWRALTRRLTNLSEFEEILFVGGGAEVLRVELLANKEMALARVVENPQFANARGVLKYMTFVGKE